MCAHLFWELRNLGFKCKNWALNSRLTRNNNVTTKYSKTTVTNTKKKREEEHFLTLDWTHLHRRARSGFDLPAWRMSYGARKHLALSTYRAVPSTVQLIAHTRSSILLNFHHNLSPAICHAWHVRNVVRTPNLVAQPIPGNGFQYAKYIQRIVVIAHLSRMPSELRARASLTDWLSWQPRSLFAHFGKFKWILTLERRNY